MKTYAVITGASAGIGKEFAKLLAVKGYGLILVARREERLKHLASELSVECEIIAADLGQEEECYKVYEQIKDKNIHIFINNAGFGDCGNFLQTNLDKELDMIEVNIKAVHIFTKLMLRKMQIQNRGYILNVSSSAGLMPAGPYMATYYATKAYIASMTRAVAKELRNAHSNVYIGCLCPGPVDTEFNQVANVEFALKGIRADECAKYALKQMEKKKVVIIPTMKMKLAITSGRFLPTKAYISIASHQQRKKFQK